MTRNLEEMMTAFRIKMGTKMLEKDYQGYAGWDDPVQISNTELITKLEANVADGDWVDVANLAAILWYREAAPQPVSGFDRATVCKKCGSDDITWIEYECDRCDS